MAVMQCKEYQDCIFIIPYRLKSKVWFLFSCVCVCYVHIPLPFQLVFLQCRNIHTLCNMWGHSIHSQRGFDEQCSESKWFSSDSTFITSQISVKYLVFLFIQLLVRQKKLKNSSPLLLSRRQVSCGMKIKKKKKQHQVSLFVDNCTGKSFQKLRSFAPGHSFCPTCKLFYVPDVDLALS